MQYNKNGVHIGVYCFMCSGESLSGNSSDKGNMQRMDGIYSRWQRYRCVKCKYECSYDEQYVKRHAIRE